ncbi:MAG: hypothetical protein NTW14_11135 [bacterium]|nr:hypothetical protein [bacterium]
MHPEKNTESEEILEFRLASEEWTEDDFSYNEAVMDESIADFLKEAVVEPR